MENYGMKIEERIKGSDEVPSKGFMYMSIFAKIDGLF
jgi:hypothetical protein